MNLNSKFPKTQKSDQDDRIKIEFDFRAKKLARLKLQNCFPDTIPVVAVQRYPMSSNLYDSLSEGVVSQAKKNTRQNY